MGGGPGGTGGGVESSSILWAIIISAFAGAFLVDTTVEAIW